MKTAIIIPARLGSTRLPRKLLLDRTGKSVLQHTWEACCRSKFADHVLVATPDEEIAEHVVCFGGAYTHTDSHRSHVRIDISRVSDSDAIDDDA